MKAALVSIKKQKHKKFFPTTKLLNRTQKKLIVLPYTLSGGDKIYQNPTVVESSAGE